MMYERTGVVPMKMSDAQKDMAGRSIVLIVDDMPANLKVLGSILSESGFEVAVAVNGAQALSVASVAPPSIILMDVSMPEMDGYTACERLKADPKTAGIPVIFVSAHREENEIIRGFEAGGIDYVTKPFNAHELMARILTHLELRESQERILRINEELARSEENLRLANSQKDKFLSILAHDLKGPVGSFRQVTEVLTTSGSAIDEATKAQFLKDLHNSASSLQALLDNILTWARSQTGRIEFQPSLHPLLPLIREVISYLEATARQKDITITTTVSEGTEAFFDVNMVHTILRNLVSNAVKFSIRGGTITITSEKQGEFLALSVADRGVGLSPSDMEKLFRIDVPHTSIGTGKEKGTGLGLLLCREFAEKNGGSISVKSERGKGSIFTFTLPLSESALRPQTAAGFR